MTNWYKNVCEERVAIKSGGARSDVRSRNVRREGAGAEKIKFMKLKMSKMT